MRRSTLIVMILLPVLILGLLVAGCGGTATTSSTQAGATSTSSGSATTASNAGNGGTITIGALLDMTGPSADLGPRFKAGIDLALKEANNTVAGKKINLVVADSATSVPTALAKFKELVEREGAKIVIGPLMGDSQLAIAPYAAEKKVTFTALFNGPIEVEKYKDVLIYPTSLGPQCYPLGTYMYEKLGYRKMLLIGSDFSGMRGFGGGVMQGFIDAGGTVVDQLWAPLGTSDFSPFIAKLKAESANADVINFSLNAGDATQFISQYRDSGTTLPLTASVQDGIYTPDALKELGDKALNIIGESSYIWGANTPINQKFVADIKAMTGNIPTGSEQNGYAIAKVVLAALEATGGDDSYDKFWPAATAVKLDPPGAVVLLSRWGGDHRCVHHSGRKDRRRHLCPVSAVVRDEAGAGSAGQVAPICESSPWRCAGWARLEPTPHAKSGRAGFSVRVVRADSRPSRTWCRNQRLVEHE